MILRIKAVRCIPITPKVPQSQCHYSHPEERNKQKKYPSKLLKKLQQWPENSPHYSVASPFFPIHILGRRQYTGFSRTLSPSSLGLRKEKLSHLHFYFHDIVSGRNPSAVKVAEAAMTNTSLTGFGLVVMADDPLTAGPEPGSKLLGKAQGIYASAAQDEVGLLMVMNFAFVEGKYNGSNLSLLGRNKVFNKIREMPIVGGSGLFRFARGYAQAKTHTFDLKTGDAVVEYNVYVFHY
ncbi:dirigent protein 22-like [Neltuma alba]|uniref:dirigent protein 22-like n=1 Tax=Neltuma alba TaxID=207710 RepID=UPI0010A38F00|nr:dirigent protein 22-like [Prosopis alba]